MFKYVINKKLAEETGIHSGDGSMNIYKGVSTYTLACHHIDDKEYMDTFLVPLYDEIYDIKPKARRWSKGSYGFRIHDKKIIGFKHDILGLPYGKKSHIEIPSAILKRTDLMKAFIKGFVDTDGGINTFLANQKKVYPRIEMCNTSIELVNQINRSLLDLGFKTSIWTVNHNKPGWRTALRLTVNGFHMLKKWKKEIGFSNPKNIEKLDKLGI